MNGTELTKKRNRRTTDQLIADLEARIEAVRNRAATREAKASPENRALLAAVKAIDKALAVAGQEKNQAAKRALEAARAPLGQLLVEMGLRLSTKRGGRHRPGTDAA